MNFPKDTFGLTISIAPFPTSFGEKYIKKTK